uniref:Uncharacterized protein n=1 Tax=Moniliophthora roreri TaxID=221103 RepID=A0A0W0F4T8_MONRR
MSPMEPLHLCMLYLKHILSTVDADLVAETHPSLRENLL